MHAITDFIAAHTDQERPDAGAFEVENRATLQINLRGTVYAKAGAMVGRTSGESVQMRFAGSGWVMVQPYEEAPVVQAR
jgi:uncharacterized protein (AIM24 family)